MRGTQNVFGVVALVLIRYCCCAESVTTLRVPDGGIQPQVMADAKNVVHMIYYKGDPGAGDLYYVKSGDGAKFSEPLKVNSNPGSAIAAGNIRGAHIALGKNNRVHVAWMGSSKAVPKGPKDASPMLYARLNDAGTAFEPQRNVMQFATGLDGGGTVAADANGNVIVTWHGSGAEKGEQYRQVFVARSADDGKTFAREVPAITQPTGACACCGMSAFAGSDGHVFIMYRGATGTRATPDNRNIFLLASKDKGATFQAADLHPWKLNQCAMSSSSFAESSGSIFAAWETAEQVYFTKINASTFQPAPPVSAPNSAKKRKHPSVAANGSGATILAWTEGMGWQKGGSANWQIFDKSGKPIGEAGKADGVPANSVIAAFARADGNFVVVY